MVGGPLLRDPDVPSMSFIALFSVLGAVVFAPVATERMFKWWLNRSPNCPCQPVASSRRRASGGLEQGFVHDHLAKRATPCCLKRELAFERCRLMR